MTPQEQLDKLVAEGATMKQLVDDAPLFILSACEILRDGKLIYIPIFPESGSDSHFVHYKKIIIPHDLGVMFETEEGNSFYVTTIEESVYDDETREQWKSTFTKWKRAKTDYRDFIDSEIKYHRKGK